MLTWYMHIRRIVREQRLTSALRSTIAETSRQCSTLSRRCRLCDFTCVSWARGLLRRCWESGRRARVEHEDTWIACTDAFSFLFFFKGLVVL
mmetsp:Transcript_15135/g.33838  ORF Transcript_15135/g.33838 Transcript_15135/m.33838 type:complete len:92 (+) Transcript_15135:358-633(+)